MAPVKHAPGKTRRRKLQPRGPRRHQIPWTGGHTAASPPPHHSRSFVQCPTEAGTGGNMAPVSHSRSRRSGRWLLAATSAVAALGLAGCSIDLSHLAPGGDEEDDSAAEETEPVPAEPLLESALTDLAEYPALIAEGQIAESVGADVQDASLTVADGGAANGTLRLNEVEA